MLAEREWISAYACWREEFLNVECAGPWTPIRGAELVELFISEHPSLKRYRGDILEIEGSGLHVVPCQSLMASYHKRDFNH